MDCQTVRRTLEFARPQEDRDAAVDEAARHLKVCPQCQAAVRRQERFEARVGTMIRDIAVPAGLKDRLLSSLAAAEGNFGSQMEAPAVVMPVKAVDSPTSKPSRRKWLVGLATAACLAIGGVGAWLAFAPLQPVVAMDDLSRAVLAATFNPAAASAFTGFDNETKLRLPESMLSQGLPTPKSVTVGGRAAAVYVFELPVRRGPSLPGRLIVIPVSELKDPPAAQSFRSGPTIYRAPYSTTAWVEGELAYLCCLAGGENELDRLRPSRPVAI